MLELKRGGHARVHTEMVEFTALPFPFSSKLKIRSFQVNCRIRYNSVRMKLHNSQSIQRSKRRRKAENHVRVTGIFAAFFKKKNFDWGKSIKLFCEFWPQKYRNVYLFGLLCNERCCCCCARACALGSGWWPAYGGYPKGPFWSTSILCCSSSYGL